MAFKIYRTVMMLVGLIVGFVAGDSLYIMLLEPADILPRVYAIEVIFAVVIALLFALIIFIIARPLLKYLSKIASIVEKQLSNVPFRGRVTGIIGLIAGLVVGVLVSSAFKELPIIGPYMPLLITLVLGYLGAFLGYQWRDRLLSFTENILINRRQLKENRQAASEINDLPIVSHPKVLDTSVIIDGRIVDIAKSGFIEGPLVVTQFVLDELRHIADSGDALKRNRGRRGLDILNELQSLDVSMVTITKDYKDIVEVDAKLVQLARELGGYVVTNDYNLNKVASFQKVRVLNINELAGAIKTVVLPGEMMRVEVIARGKGAEQGVGYLDDGTMIVVESGREHIGETLDTIVTSVIQTNAGRMIFARLEE